MKAMTRRLRSGPVLGTRVLEVAGLVTLMTLLSGGSVFGQQVERSERAEEDATVQRASANAPVELYVRNNNWLDARIYAVRQGTRYRLGTVTSFQIERFELPGFVSAGVDGVQILILPIGGGTSYVTEEIPVMPGDVLGLEVEEHLPLTAFFRSS